MVRSIAILAALGLLLSDASATDLPCPKRVACWQVRIAVATFGEATMREKARACGWTEARIAAAEKCLRTSQIGESR